MVKRLPTCGRPGFNPWVGKIPWRRKWQPTPVLLPRKSHGWRSLLQATVHGGHKDSGMTERLHFNSNIVVVNSKRGHFSKFAPKAQYDEIENDDTNEIIFKNILWPYNYY